ncbi:hypothetical protein MH215_03525 [Paenibacillus sp. ACRSA]|uniref:hypothetical protein n=1 Tax=Paenibacillus sp. ACRSA TaxID=2918211 RepID=UPI001EF5AF42|nr:hypothetical protein [Paenibacillus sp. ACRSA]MCG7376049.1 hypothetical protein [Paenibacillus sp. ACRSA]
MNKYMLSVTQKIDHYFNQQEITNIIYLQDEEDHERLDQVVFLEKSDGDVIGIYIRGMNPLISANRIDDVDDFNLYATYEGLLEYKEKLNFKIEYIGLVFGSQYNELLGLYLSNDEASESIFMLFLQDEILVEQGCSKVYATRVLDARFSANGYVTYIKESEKDWTPSCM